MNPDEIVHNMLVQTLGQQQLTIIQTAAQLQSLKAQIAQYNTETKSEGNPTMQAVKD